MTAEEEEARDRLLFHLENQSGFWFALVVGDDPRPRDRLREAAEAWCNENGRTFILHEPEPEGLVRLVVSLASGESPGVHWIRADGVKGVIDAWDAGNTQMLMAMNERREAYRKRLDGGVVVEGRLSLKRILREMAPDMFSIRAFIAEPGEDPMAPAKGPPEWRRPFGLTSLISGDAVDPDLALANLARLTLIEGPTSTQTRIYAEVQAMESLFNAGRYNDAENHARGFLLQIEQDIDKASEEGAYLRAWTYDVLARTAILTSDDAQNASSYWDRGIEALKAHLPGDDRGKFFYGILLFRIIKGQALAFLRQNNASACKGALQRQIQSWAPVAANLLPEMQLDLVDSHIKLADILEEAKEYDHAEQVLQKAIALAKECTSRQPRDPRWRLEVLICNTALGGVYVRKGDLDTARKTLLYGAALAEELETYGEAGDPQREVLERFYRHLGVVLSTETTYSRESDRFRERALYSIRSQFERAQDKSQLGWLLAQLYLDRATLLEKDDLAGAKESARMALDLVARLPVRNEEDAALKTRIEALRAFAGNRRRKHRTSKP